MSSARNGMSRHAATRRVMKTLATGTTTINLPFTAPDGTQPLVITTPNEYVSEVLKRIESVGGSANVALAEAKRFTVFAMEGEPSGIAGDDVVSEEISMGMFWLRASQWHKKHGRAATFTIGNLGVGMPSAASFAYAV